MSASVPRSHRGSIALEEARILAHAHFDADQHVLRLQAPRCAARAQPGSFVHLRCAEDLPMRRPMSIMRADPGQGWIELLYKVVGAGSAALARRQVNETLSVLGPIGRGFEPRPERPKLLALGGGVGIPPMVFLSERLRADSAQRWQPLVLMGSELPFPFRTRPSAILLPGIPEGTIACMPLLDEWGVPSRLASLSGFAGCYEGYVTELAAAWLRSLDASVLGQVQLCACGPTAMLAATARLAHEFSLPCQVALEELMACAVGGCAGCAVAVRTDAGVAMKRVCVDGPVFEAESVFG